MNMIKPRGNLPLRRVTPPPMRRTCAAKWCFNYQGDPKGRHRSFHSFPKDTCRAQLWLKFCQINGPSKGNWKNIVVCSDHFQEPDFKTRHPRRLLHYGAIPSVKQAQPGLDSETDESAELRVAGLADDSARLRLAGVADESTLTHLTGKGNKLVYPQDRSLFSVEEVTYTSKNGPGPSAEPHHPQPAIAGDLLASHETARSRSQSSSPLSIPYCSPNRPSSPTPPEDIPAWAIALRNQFYVLNEKFSQIESNVSSHAEPPIRLSFEGLRCGKPPEIANIPADDECLELFYGLRKQLLVPELSEKDRHEIIHILNMAAEWKSLPPAVKGLLYKLGVLIFDNTL